MIDLSHYRTPTGLLIDELSWKTLRSAVPDDALAEALCAASEGMPMPDSPLTAAQASGAFERLRAASLTDLLEPKRIKLLRCPPTVQPNYCTALKPPGNEAANYFFHRIRLRTPKANYPSPWEKWHDPALRLRVFRRFLHFKRETKLDGAATRRALHQTGATPAQFKPGVAKAVYELTGAKRVLDLSMGWGDRLAGFCASSSTGHYTGIDPNPELHPLYLEQMALYGTTKGVTLVNAPAETVPAFPAGSFDLAFTSPPYFGTERYGAGTTHEGAQSWHRYQAPHEWRDGFLRPTIEKAWQALTPGGVLALNIADIAHKGVCYPLCTWVQEIVSRLPAARFHFALGMRLQSANYSSESRSEHSGEPIWFWSKGERALPWHLPTMEERARSDRVALAAERAAAKAAEASRPKAWWTRKGVRGSPPTPPDVVAQVITDYRSGLTPPRVATKNGISKPTTYRILHDAGVRLIPGKPATTEKPPG
jgi:hypothetical protein